MHLLTKVGAIVFARYANWQLCRTRTHTDILYIKKCDLFSIVIVSVISNFKKKTTVLCGETPEIWMKRFMQMCFLFSCQIVYFFALFRFQVFDVILVFLQQFPLTICDSQLALLARNSHYIYISLLYCPLNFEVSEVLRFFEPLTFRSWFFAFQFQ